MADEVFEVLRISFDLIDCPPKHGFTCCEKNMEVHAILRYIRQKFLIDRVFREQTSHPVYGRLEESEECLVKGWYQIITSSKGVYDFGLDRDGDSGEAETEEEG